MIRATSLILAALASVPAAAQTQAPPSVETVQAALDAELAAPHDEITVTHARDDMKKTSLLVRTISTSKTLRRCETEFATPVEKINANAKSERSWRVAWGSIAEARRDGPFKLELVANKPDGVRTILKFPDSDYAADFGEGFDYLRQHCAG
jgi:hypothetical protein